MNLSYTIKGEGIPLIFLHGFMEDKSMWDFAPDLFPNHTIIQIDLPGHGESDDVHSEFHLSQIAQQIANEILPHLTEKPIIIGHSLGGYIGLEWILSDLPIHQLILMHSHPFPDNPQKKIDRKRMADLVLTAKETVINQAIPNLFVDKKNHQKEIKKTIETALKCKAFSIAHYALAMKNRMDYSTNEKINTAPIAIIHGELDQIIPGDELIAWSKELNHKIIIIKNTGHMSHIEQAEELHVSLKYLILNVASV